jgi:serine protease inhibitor
METLAHYWQQDMTNKNVDTNINLNITVSILNTLYREQLKNKQLTNICISPLSLCLALQQTPELLKDTLKKLNINENIQSLYSNYNYQSIYESLVKLSDGTISLVTQLQAQSGTLDIIAKQISEKYAYIPESGRTIVPEYPLKTKLPTSTNTNTSAEILQNLFSFTGYWAPQFYIHNARLPPIFTNLDGTKTITNMLLKSSKMWYTETEEYQMIDIPYMNQNFAATVIIPR